MARLELSLIREECRDVNARLEESLPGRTKIMIQSRRRRADYHSIRDSLALTDEIPRWTCHVCGKSCSSQAGLGVHVASAHQAVSNVTRLEKTQKTKARWDPEEDRILARALVKEPDISNTALAGLLRGRSVEAVKKRKRCEAVSSLVSTLRDLPDSIPEGPATGATLRGGSVSPDGCGGAARTGSLEDAGHPGLPQPSDPSSPSSSNSSDEEDDLEALRRAIMAPLAPEESDDRLFPGLLTEIASSNNRSMEEIQRHITLCLPQLSSDPPAPPRHLSRDRGRPQPRSRRARRREQYRALQKFYSKNRNKAVLAAIDGTWSTPDDRPSSRQMIDFWRPLFESPDIPDEPRFVDSVQQPTLYHLQAPVSLLDISSALRGLRTFRRLDVKVRTFVRDMQA